MKQYTFTYQQIIHALSQLNIKHNNEVKKDWLGVLCPLPRHGKPDRHFGNCGIHIPTGVISCFACGSGSIITLYRNTFNLSYEDAIKNILGTQYYDTNTKEERKEDTVEETPGPSLIDCNFTHIPFNPNNFFYTSQRGFTENFCRTFKITHCISNPYDDYFIIPVVDKEKQIREFECRKLKKYEYLQKFYDDYISPYDFLNKSFERYIETNQIVLKKGKLYKRDQEFYNDTLYYLLRGKVLYPPNSNLYRTLWNIDNLKYTEPLYVVEGIGSIPKIYENISKNCTTFFGVKISKEQIEYLNKFKTIIHLPDPDQAGYNSVVLLNEKLNNEYLIKDIKIEDTHSDYISTIKNSPNLTPTEYFRNNLKYYFQTSKS